MKSVTSWISTWLAPGRLVFASVLGAVVLVVAACGDNSDTESGKEPGGDAMREITVTGHDLRFEPADLRLVAGEPVRLTFVNEGSVEHDLSVSGLNATGNVLDANHAAGHGDGDSHTHESSSMEPGTVHLAVSPGKRVSVEFTPSAGTFEAVCTVPGHREAGMVGTVVSE